MGNSDAVFPYSADYEQWLRQLGYPCPSVRAANRMPKTNDILWAISQFPTVTIRIYQPYLELLDENSDGITIVGPNWEDDQSTARYLSLRYSRDWEIALVAKLCQRCGQLVIYPDSGASAIIIDENIDVEHYVHIWKLSWQQDDDWRYVHEALYGHL